MSLEKSLAAALANPRAGLLELDRIEQEESLSAFLKGGWKYIDPAPYVHGWHLDAIAEHLEAITRGDIRRLIINVPPRHSKSSVVSVAWPVWTWSQGLIGPLSGPHVQFLSASYAQALSTRDALKSRRLIQSPWFQERWGDAAAHCRFTLTSDQNAKMRYDNDRGGYRIATSVDGGLTGEGGSVILVDDPLNAKEAVSEATRISMVDWWDQAMSTRLNDPKTGAYVVIMQRLHEEDLTGHILSSNHDGWEHLCLPARYEPDRHCVTSIGWEDPRTREGELLAPERFDEESLSHLERSLGPYGAAGQLQQRPQPAGGGIFRRDWWGLWDEETAQEYGCLRRSELDPTGPPRIVFPPCEYVVASLDPAYTEKQENDYSALTVWGLFRDRRGLARIILMHGWQKRLPIHGEEQEPRRSDESYEKYRARLENSKGLVEAVADTCKRFSVDRLLVESKASGISVAQELRRLHAGEGWGIDLIDPGRQDKIARAYSVQPLFADHMVYAPDREWADVVLSQMESFPKAAHDDLVDSATQALRHLRDIGLAVHAAEAVREYETASAYRPESKPLYPV